MTAGYFVIYEGSPHDPDEWVRYYLEHHVPLVWKFPGIKGVEVHLGRDTDEVFMLTRLEFDDLAQLRTAIDSEERLEARRDMNENLLPRFEGIVRHQATEIVKVAKPA